MIKLAAIAKTLVVVSGLALAVPAMADPVAEGQMTFKQMCGMCHVVNKGQNPTVAPNLNGVVGRKAASTGFNYSPALKASGLTWNKGNLDKFLSGPMKMVPGTRMVVQIPDAGKRQAVIAYLASLK